MCSPCGRTAKSSGSADSPCTRELAPQLERIARLQHDCDVLVVADLGCAGLYKAEQPETPEQLSQNVEEC